MSANVNLTLPKKYAAQKIINLLTMGVMFGMVIWSGFFVYQYAYQTLNNVNSIILLNSNLGVNSIDVHAYELSQSALKLKKDITNPPKILRNIFYYAKSNITNQGPSAPKK